MAKKKQPSVEGIMNVFFRAGAEYNLATYTEYKNAPRVLDQSKKLRAALKKYLKQF